MEFHKDTSFERRTGWITSELYYWHDTQNWSGFLEPSTTVQPGLHFENPETKRRMQNLVEAVGLGQHLVPLKPEIVSTDIIQLVHPQSHIDKIKKVCDSGGGDAGSMTPVGPASFDIANLSVGGIIKAIDELYAGNIDNAYVLCRPPGHHAISDLAMGFCIFANAAIGIRYAQKRYNAGKVVSIDWDVHHGNGTETIFIDDPNVLTISLHQNNLFPSNSGGTETTTFQNSNLNIPLPPGSGSGAYRAAFEKLVLPAVDEFEPQLIIIPSGFDSCALDPLGRQLLSSEDYRWMTRQLLQSADKHCEGRVIATHEGGYSATYVPYCGLAVLEELSGASECFEDPFKEMIANYGGQSVSNDQWESIKAASTEYFTSNKKGR